MRTTGSNFGAPTRLAGDYNVTQIGGILTGVKAAAAAGVTVDPYSVADRVDQVMPA